MSIPVSQRLDAHSLRRQFMRRARRMEDADFLLREIEQRMFDRLDLIKLQPLRLIDLGCGRGQGLAVLSERFPQALCMGLDFALPMLKQHSGSGRFISALSERLPAPLRHSLAALGPRAPGLRIGGDAHFLPLRNSCVDLLWSNLCWHWLVDPMAALADWYRVIRPEGLLMFSSFGVDTAKELAALGWPVPQFPDLHDIGDALGRNGFAEPVMDAERLTLEYRDADKLIAELSALGGNAASDRAAGLRTRNDLARWRAAIEVAIHAGGGVFQVTIEVVYGHAWCAVNKKLPAGLAPVNWRPGNVSRK
jgi:malonyl-CoA O-methyltransferase